MRDDRCITTYTGLQFWPLNPEGCEVRVEDIAHSLAFTCRFNGHTRQFYSVAQHSVEVAFLLNALRSPYDSLLMVLQGLLHDASEAYLHDIVRPIKNSVQIDGEPYDAVEERLMRHVYASLDVPWPIPAAVWEADNALLATEMRDLMDDEAAGKRYGRPLLPKLTVWTPAEAETNFLDYYHDLLAATAPERVPA